MDRPSLGATRCWTQATERSRPPEATEAQLHEAHERLQSTSARAHPLRSPPQRSRRRRVLHHTARAEPRANSRTSRRTARTLALDADDRSNGREGALLHARRRRGRARLPDAGPPRRPREGDRRPQTRHVAPHHCVDPQWTAACACQLQLLASDRSAERPAGRRDTCLHSIGPAPGRLLPQPQLLMPIIQFVLPSKSKQIKKLLQ